MQKKPFISIVIPAYKEESRIHKVLNAIVEYKSRHNFSIEVIVVLDGTLALWAEASWCVHRANRLTVLTG